VALRERQFHYSRFGLDGFQVVVQLSRLRLNGILEIAVLSDNVFDFIA
jgi:hypothetical protein